MSTKIARRILVLVPVAFVLLSYQNCSTGFDSATGPRFDSNGNLIPAPAFSTSPTSSATSTANSNSRSSTTTSDSYDSDQSLDEGSAKDSGVDETTPYTRQIGVSNSNSISTRGVHNMKSRLAQCIEKKVSAKQRARTTANALESAKKFLQSRRCNSFLSGPNGQARHFLAKANIENFCGSDFQNTISVLRQVGRMAGMQDIDQHNAVEKWIDCFCNVSGRSVCPELKAKRPKDIFDVQDHFADPKYRRPAMKIENLPSNDDEVVGVDDILND